MLLLSISEAKILYPQIISKIKEGEEVAFMKTDKGEIKTRFSPEYAPKTAENFITHAPKWPL